MTTRDERKQRRLTNRQAGVEKFEENLAVALKRIANIEEHLRSSDQVETLENYHYLVQLAKSVNSSINQIEMEFHKMRTYYAHREEAIRQVMGEDYDDWKQKVEAKSQELIVAEINRRKAPATATTPVSAPKDKDADPQLEDLRKKRLAELEAGSKKEAVDAPDGEN